MTIEDKIAQHVNHGFQAKSEALKRWQEHYRKTHGTDMNSNEQTLLELVWMEAWRESRADWRLHNG